MFTMNVFIIGSFIALTITVPYSNAVHTAKLREELDEVLRTWFNYRSATDDKQKPDLLKAFEGALANVTSKHIYYGSVVAGEVRSNGNLVQLYNSKDLTGSPNNGAGIAPETKLLPLGIARLDVAPQQLTEPDVLKYAEGKAQTILGAIDKLVVRYQGFKGPVLKPSLSGVVVDDTHTKAYVFIIMALADEK